MPKYSISLEHLAELSALVGWPIAVGHSGRGVRLILPVIEGSVTGEKLNGRVCPVGADWALIRADNCMELDVRALVETEDGAKIHISYTGIIDMTKEQVEQMMAGQALTPAPSTFTTPRFETGHEHYSWLNRIQAVGRGTAEPEEKGLRVCFSWYVLTV
ncbi:MAG: DUF3237 domain-containing protein [Acidobacteriota bacterium]